MVAVMTTALRRIPSRKQTDEQSGHRSKSGKHGGLSRFLDSVLGFRIGLVYALFGFRLRQPGAVSNDLGKSLLAGGGELTRCHRSDERA